MSYRLLSRGVLRLSDNLPITRDMPEWAEYRAHLLAGNTPLPMIPPPGPTLADIKATKRAEITAARNKAITSGFEYMGKSIDSDRDSVMAITGAAVAALAASAAGLPYSVTWTCADDSTITLDANGVLGLAVGLAIYADAQHTKGRPLKDAIKASATDEEVAAIVWEVPEPVPTPTEPI